MYVCMYVCVCVCVCVCVFMYCHSRRDINIGKINFYSRVSVSSDSVQLNVPK